MPRKRREWYEGACYHVMGRGNRRSAIYNDREDCQMFLRLLSQVMKKTPFTLHAYCLMTNHFHLELTTAEDPIWSIMQPIMNHYSKNFNQKYGLVGHLYDSRYTSCLIKDDTYFLEVSRYIHLNPVKAGIVREPLAYEFCSYRDYMADPKKAGKLTDTSRVLSYFGDNPREQYRMFVEGKISHAEQEKLIQNDMREDDLWLP